MDFCESLARTCIAARQKRAEDPDPASLRSEFERLSARERVLRESASGMQEEAKRTAARQRVSGSGPMATFLKRLFVPIPLGAGETALRAGGAGLGGYYGHRAAKPGLTPKELGMVMLPPERGGGPAGPIGAAEHLENILRPIYQQAQLPAGVEGPARMPLIDVTKLLAGSPEKDVLAALGKRPLGWVPGMGLSESQQKIREAVTGAFGQGGPGQVIGRLGSAAERLKSKQPAAMPRTSSRQMLGTVLGAYLGSVAGGLPSALRAAWKARSGGEASANLAAKAQAALREADEAAASRDRLLTMLGAK